MIRIGPSGLGAAKDASKVLQMYHDNGLTACEVAFTYSTYLKEKDAVLVGKVAEKLNIKLSIHASFFINLNSDDDAKIEKSKSRLIDACRIGHHFNGSELTPIVFHAGFYGKNKEGAFSNIAAGVLDIMSVIKDEGLKVRLCPETMGKVNVFGSIEEIAQLRDETGCSFCIDFAHILARYKEVDYSLIENLFPEREWHCHFSGIEYNEKGERKHLATEEKEWEKLFSHLPSDKNITIINESPLTFDDAVMGLEVLEKRKIN